MRTVFLAIFFAICGIASAQEVQVNSSTSEVKWIGKKATGDHNGKIHLKEGKLIIDKGELTGGYFIIDMNTISCEDLPGRGKEKLERHLKSDDFFGVSDHPTAKFVITNVSVEDASVFQVSGKMTIKGITNSMQFPTKLEKQGSQFVATAKVIVDRSKFDVRYGSGSFFDNLGDRLIYDDFELNVSLKTE